MISFEEVTFEILEVIVEYLNTKVIIYLTYYFCPNIVLL